MNDIRCPLNRTAEKFSDRPALINSQKSITYSALDKLVHLAAVSLTKKGVHRGTKIAVIGTNSIEYCVLILAVLRIGAIICPINYRLPQKAVQTQLKTLNCKFLVLINYSKSVFTVPGVRLFLIEELVSDLTGRKTFGSEPVVSFQNPAAVVFTSGTSDTPKAALLSYGNFYFNALGANERIPFDENHHWLLTLPLYHVGGLGILFRAIIGGGAVVVLEKNESVFEAINKFEITHLSLVPTQLYRLFNGPIPEFSKTAPIVLTGGGPISRKLLQKCRKAKLNLYRTYGLTEMTSQVTTGKCGKGAESGSLLKYRELEISHEGEILVKGKTLFQGYLKNDSIELPLDSKGWFHTGDMGELNPKGLLTVLGRKDHLFISGGENIHPEEIESHLMKIDGIEQALVVGISDEEFGARPAAFIKYSNGETLSQKEITALLEKELPRYKIPKSFLEWPENLDNGALKLPRTEFLKLAESLLPKLRKQIQEVFS